MTIFEELQNLMLEYRFRPSKKLSQFFCINEALLVFLTKKIDLKKGDVVLEVGPGTGFFTRLLIDYASRVGARVIAVEVSEVLFELLSNKFSNEISAGVLTLIKGDALDLDWSELRVNKIASFPPYHISSELVTKIVLTNNLVRVLLVLDSGFVEKLTAFEGFSEYGALTALVNLNASVSVVEDGLAPQTFFPVPNCQSSVIELVFDYKNNSLEFFCFLKEIFRHKNKDLQKAVKQSTKFISKRLGWDSDLIESSISSYSSAKKKVYLFSPDELLRVFVYLDSFQKKLVKKRDVINSTKK